MWSSFFSWLRTAFEFIFEPAPPPPGATLAALIASVTLDIPAMPGTGGVIHKLSTSQIANTANVMKLAIVSQPTTPLRVDLALLSAYGRQESRFDEAADDPNDQLAQPGETPEQAYYHEDCGFGQIDGATAAGFTEFAGVAWQAVRAKLFTLAYAVPKMVSIIAANLAFAKECIAKYPNLLGSVPNGDWRVFAFEMYNSGPEGALEMALAGTTKKRLATAKQGASLWSYGESVLATYLDYATILSVPPLGR